MPTKHSTNVVVADDGTSPVGSDEWNADHIDLYAPGSFTIPTGAFVIMSKRIVLTGSQRLTIQGTGRLRIT